MKKTMEKLNKHLFPLVVAFVLFLGICAPVKASAAHAWEYFDYTKMDYSVKYGTDFNTVFFDIPAEWYQFNVYDGNSTSRYWGSDILEVNVTPGTVFDITVYPVGSIGFLLDNIPAGSKLYVELVVDESQITPHTIGGSTDIKASGNYLDVNSKYIKYTSITPQLINSLYSVNTYALDFTIDDIAGARYFVPGLTFDDYNDSFTGVLRVQLKSAYVEMEVDTQFWSQFQTQQNGKMLGEIKDTIEESTDKIMNGTDEQHAIVNDSVQGMEQAGNKLDGLGDQLNSVEKPDVNTFNVGIGDMIGDTASVPMLTAPIREIWENPVALGILTIVVTLVLVSWVFFGKK